MKKQRVPSIKDFPPAVQEQLKALVRAAFLRRVEREARERPVESPNDVA